MYKLTEDHKAYLQAFIELNKAKAQYKAVKDLYQSTLENAKEPGPAAEQRMAEALELLPEIERLNKVCCDLDSKYDNLLTGPPTPGTHPA